MSSAQAAPDPIVVDSTSVSMTDGNFGNGLISGTMTSAMGAIEIKNNGHLVLNGVNNTATTHQSSISPSYGVNISGAGSSLIVNGNLAISDTDTVDNPYGIKAIGTNDVTVNGMLSIISTHSVFNGGYGVFAQNGSHINLGSASVISLATTVSAYPSIGLYTSDGTTYSGRRTEIYANNININAGGGAHAYGSNNSSPLIQFTGTNNKITLSTLQTSSSYYAHGLLASGATINVGDKTSNTKGSISITSRTDYVNGINSSNNGSVNLYGDDQKIMLAGNASRAIFVSGNRGNIDITGDNYHFETSGNNSTTIRLEGDGDSGSLTINNLNAGNNIIAATGSNSYAVNAIGVTNSTARTDQNKLSITQKGGKIYSEQSVAIASSGKMLELNLDNVESYGGTYLVRADDLVSTVFGNYAHAVVNLNAQNNSTLRGDILLNGKYESYVSGGGRQVGQININLDSGSSLTGNVFAKGAGVITLNLDNSTMTGDVNADAINYNYYNAYSTSNINVKGASLWKGNALTTKDWSGMGIVNVVTDNTATWEGYAQNAQVSVLGSSTWKMTSSSAINGLTHQGTIAFAAPGTTGFKTLTINGDYIGQGGLFVLNAALGDDNAPSDKVVITGNTSGNAYITVANAGGMGAQPNQGMKLVSIGGASNASFALAAPAAVGVYQYNAMAKGTDGSWYLTYTDNPTPPTPPTPDPDPNDQSGNSNSNGNNSGNNGGNSGSGGNVNSNLVRPAITAYLTNLTAAGNMFMASMQDRFYTQDLNKNSRGAWAYTTEMHQEYYANNKITDTKTNRTVIQIGTDVMSLNLGSANLGVGVMAGYGHDNTGLRSDSDAIAFGGSKATATTQMNGYNIGLYGTLIQQDKYYLDAWAQYSWYNNKVKASYYTDANYDSTAFGMAMEGGYTFEIADKLFIEPKVRLGYVSADSDNYNDNGTQVSNADYGNFFTKMGVRLRSKQFAINPYVELNWQMNTSRASASFNDIYMTDDSPKNIYEVKAGLAGYVTQNVQMWGSVGGQFGKSKYQSAQGTIGVQYLW